MVEFLFLTGCRPGEAFALRWQDVMLSRNIIRFSKSYAASIKSTKRTKTKTVRMFPIHLRLLELLVSIKPVGVKSVDLVFRQTNGQTYNTRQLNYVWLGEPTKSHGFLGVVNQLVKNDKISQYLPPYHARHTYITLTAHANKNNTSALLLLAHACGNSPEVIMKHYLDVDRSVELAEV
ncbi:MAG: tyrosine-type recombinase/integrase [Microcoleus sp. SM1_3_4]|nr:tyrosine-type recombinase/integrase [Microcoleus sp. SM1_3_4]